jgi:hypothetical protein
VSLAFLLLVVRDRRLIGPEWVFRGLAAARWHVAGIATAFGLASVFAG